jgi:DNA-binding CsgD family transcriptional regulator
LAQDRANFRATPLSAHQIECLHLIAEGETTLEIAGTLIREHEPP